MADHQPLFGDRGSFDKAFPEVDSIEITVRHQSALNHGAEYAVTYDDKAGIPSVIPCPNPRCRQGGYAIETWLQELVRQRVATGHAKWLCDGHEEPSKGRPQGYPCMNSAEIDFRVTYKE